MPTPFRPDGRKTDQLRPWTYQWDVAPQSTGSILVSCGKTQVICAASLEEDVPRWKKAQKIPGGWLTAEYSMLPYSTPDRKTRDITKGKIDGRSQEIQRLIGRSMRAAIDLDLLGERTLWIDCDVLTADGGTRTTAITGAFLAAKLALHRLEKKGGLTQNPIKEAVAATSVGLFKNKVILDLCYLEDRDAAADMNVVMTGSGQLVEVQASGEEATFSPAQFAHMLKLASKGVRELLAFQESAWRKRPRA